MDGPQHRPVSGLQPQSRQGSIKVLFRNLPQDILAEVGADFLQFPGNRGVLIGEIRVVGAAVDNAQGVAGGPKIIVHPFHNGIGIILEINGNHAAHRRSHLIQQAAGLAEINVLRVLADLGQANSITLVLIEKAVDDIGHQYLKGSTGAQATALKNVGGGIGVKALNLTAVLGKPGGNTPDDGSGGIALLFPDGKIVQIHHVHREALALDPDNLLTIRRHRSNNVQIHTACQHPAPLMVRVVAANFCAARSRKYRSLVIRAKGRLQPGQSLLIPGSLIHRCLRTVQLFYGPAQLLGISCRRKMILHVSLQKAHIAGSNSYR